MSRPHPLTVAAGVAALGLVLTAAVLDVRLAAEHWDEMGPLAPGEELPEFRAHTLEGEVFDNATLEGQVSVLTFWATWCGACSREMPVLEQLHADYADRGVALYGVNTDRDPDQETMARDYMTERGLEFPVVLDTGRVRQGFRVSMLPHVALVDRNGRLRYVHQGTVGERTLRREIDALLSE